MKVKIMFYTVFCLFLTADKLFKSVILKQMVTDKVNIKIDNRQLVRIVIQQASNFHFTFCVKNSIFFHNDYSLGNNLNGLLNSDYKTGL